MKNIRRQIIEKVGVAALVLSIFIGSVVYFIETRFIDDQVIELTNNETTKLMSNVNEINELNEKYDALIKNSETILSSNFVVVEIYSKDKKRIFERIQKKELHIEQIIDRFDHGFLFSNEIKYEKFTIDQRVYLQVLVPLKDQNETIIGYLEGVYKVDNQKLYNLNKRLFLTVFQTISAVIFTALLLTPIIFSLNKDLILHSNKLLRANIDLLKVLSGAISKKDSDTNAHNYRVTIYAVKLAEQIGLDKQEIQKLIKGAFLHDVGKIGIYDDVLLKPGKLTAEEFEQMKIHVQHGEDIIKEAEWLKDAQDVVVYHHEKYDGSGYLKGLKGKEIPLNARIFSIADVFDALTSKRPYKEPFTYEQAISILMEGKGSQFDPYLIEEFLKISKTLYIQATKSSDHDTQNILNELLNKYFYN